MIRRRCATRKIGRDLPCVRCGYNLRGLSSADHCPECNAPANASVLRDGFLRFATFAPPLGEADGRWVRSIVGGMCCFAAVIGLEFVTPFVMEYKFDPTTGIVVRWMLAAACWGWFAAGVLKVTRVEPGADGDGMDLLRVIAAAYLLTTMLQVLIPRAPLLMGVHGAIAYPTTVLLHAHLATLARRLPNRWIPIVARVGAFALGFAGCIVTLANLRGFAPPATFGPIEPVARFILPGGIASALARPVQSLGLVMLVALGSTPLYFLLVWYIRPRAGRLKESI
jgi:hypothetical protein